MSSILTNSTKKIPPGVGERKKKMLAPTPCRIIGCENYADKDGRGACKIHQPVWQDSTRKQRLPRDWNTRRLIILKKSKNICYLCGGTATEVDHITAGDNHNLENLAAICNPCHRGKSTSEGNEAKAGNQISKQRGFRTQNPIQIPKTARTGRTAQTD